MGPIRIVLIENHGLTWRGIRLILGQSGFDLVGEATTGKQGLAIVKRYQPDIALVDLLLPDIDGISVAQHIKLMYPKTRVIILTSRDTKTATRAACAAGADSYCVKYNVRDNLVTALRATHEGTFGLMKETAVRSSSQQQTVTIEATPYPERKKLIEEALTSRELEILELIVRGNSNQTIAEQLYITVGTVKTHVRGILGKLHVDGRVQAAVYALRSGLVF